MSDRICPCCNYEFNYPSRLKKHFETVIHCRKTSDEIKEFFTNINQIVASIKCITCNKEFSRKDSLNRHLRTSKSCINKNLNINSSNTNIQEIPNTIPNQILNTNTTNNTINNNTINNTTNITNNTINIQHINPFGFEDVRTIPIDEMKTILITGQEAGFKIIKTIYNKIENKNFYKPNMSRPEIACLNTDFKLTIYRSKEFCDALFDRCITFLHHMLYLCKNEYSQTSIRAIYDNIEFIETTMRTEIYDKQLQNIIESEFRNNNVDNKDRIINFIKGIKNNNDNKEQSTTLMNNVLSLENESAREYCISITDDELNRVLGDPKVILGLNKREFIEDFKYNRFEDTRFYKFWEDRIKNETSYINKCKTATIGDMKMIKDKATKVDLMLNVIRLRADHLKPDELIDLDVDGFQIIEIEGNDVDSDDVDAANLEDLEDFTAF